MLKIDLIPHEGIIIQTIGKVCFGQKNEEVEKILGIPTTKHLSYYDNNNLMCFYNPKYVKNLPSGAVYADNMQYFYNDYEIRIDLDANQKVEFIECISGPFPDKVRPFIYDKEAFKLSANELIELLIERNNGDVYIDNPKKMKKSFSFFEIDVSIWRDMNEAEAELCIDENIADGIYDLRRSRHFWTIGIGNKGYWRNIYI